MEDIDEPVPTTVSEALRLCARWLDVADEAFTLIAELNGKVRYPEGQDACQKSLRALAGWFDVNGAGMVWRDESVEESAWAAMSQAADFTAETRMEPAVPTSTDPETQALWEVFTDEARRTIGGNIRLENMTFAGLPVRFIDER